jgi:hypothetical protein
MKQLLLFLFCFPLALFAQESTILFRLKAPINDTLAVIEIDFKNENLSSDFVLQGKIPLHYSVKMNDFKHTVLFRIQGENKAIEDEIKYPQRNHISSDSIISGIKITDFNKDGNEDIVCYVYGYYMEGAIIYLNNPSQGKLVKLWNTAEATDFWVNPVFDQSNNTIKCNYNDPDHGELFESTYVFENFTTTPVSKHQKGYVKNKRFDNRYIGEDNKWVLVKQ